MGCPLSAKLLRQEGDPLAFTHLVTGFVREVPVLLLEGQSPHGLLGGDREPLVDSLLSLWLVVS